MSDSSPKKGMQRAMHVIQMKLSRSRHVVQTTLHSDRSPIERNVYLRMGPPCIGKVYTYQAARNKAAIRDNIFFIGDVFLMSDNCIVQILEVKLLVRILSIQNTPLVT